MGVYSIYQLFKHPELILILIIVMIIVVNIENTGLQIIMFIILIIIGTIISEYIKIKYFKKK